jgi:hypothetical protein
MKTSATPVLRGFAGVAIQFNSTAWLRFKAPRIDENAAGSTFPSFSFASLAFPREIGPRRKPTWKRQDI